MPMRAYSGGNFVNQLDVTIFDTNSSATLDDRGHHPTDDERSRGPHHPIDEGGSEEQRPEPRCSCCRILLRIGGVMVSAECSECHGSGWDCPVACAAQTADQRAK